MTTPRPLLLLLLLLTIITSLALPTTQAKCRQPQKPQKPPPDPPQLLPTRTSPLPLPFSKSDPPPTIHLFDFVNRYQTSKPNRLVLNFAKRCVRFLPERKGWGARGAKRPVAHPTRTFRHTHDTDDWVGQHDDEGGGVNNPHPPGKQPRHRVASLPVVHPTRPRRRYPTAPTRPPATSLTPPLLSRPPPGTSPSSREPASSSPRRGSPRTR